MLLIIQLISECIMLILKVDFTSEESKNVFKVNFNFTF